MKTIYFIRHAKSEQHIDCDDFERPLNARGKKDAPTMAERLKALNAKPDIIITSAAKRAFATANIIAKILGIAEIRTEEGLYLTSPQTYLKIIHSIDDRYKTVFMVGHNPTITEICEALSGKFIGNIPTCGVFCIEFDMEYFTDITLNSGKKLFFDFPKNR